MNPMCLYSILILRPDWLSKNSENISFARLRQLSPLIEINKKTYTSFIFSFDPVVTPVFPAVSMTQPKD
jgi:hypothetical protein